MCWSQDGGFWNVEFPSKALGFSVLTVTSMMVGDLVLEERGRNHEARLMGSAVRTAEVSYPYGRQKLSALYCANHNHY